MEDEDTEEKLTSLDHFISAVKMFFCWDITIDFPDLYSYIKYKKNNPSMVMCWIPIEIPILQYAICIIQTVVSFYPDTVWGPNGVFIFNTIVLGFLTTYLALRFGLSSFVSKKHKEITECDSFIIQTIIFVLVVNYVYHEFLKLDNIIGI